MMNNFTPNHQATPPGSGQYQYPPPNQSFNQQSQQHQSSEAFLCEAFPNIDRATVGAILASTRGHVDPAYNALMAISSPSQKPSANNRSGPTLPPRRGSFTSPQPPVYTPPSPVPAADHSYNPYNAPPSASSSYLTPQPSASGYLSPSATNSSQPRTGSVTPLYPPASPVPMPVHDAPPSYQQYADNRQTSSMTFDMSNLNLNGSRPYERRKQSHWATCEGCETDPIVTDRWHCMVCANYDICGECRESGVHNQHRLRKFREAMEVHQNVYCDGCANPASRLEGIRFVCQTHQDEDWCELCIESGKACGGPYKEIKQTDLSLQVELAGEAPMPSQWAPYLRPTVSVFGMDGDLPKDGEGWYTDPDTIRWFDRTDKDRKKWPTDAIYQIDAKRLRGHVMSDHHYSWIMKDKNGAKLYTFERDNDRKTNAIKSEKFGPYQGRSSTPMWKRSPTGDSLSFEDVRTGTQYRWMTAHPISTLNEQRYEFNRYALFRRGGGKEVIVADWAWLNGEVGAVESVMNIRDSEVDPAMVLASFWMVNDRESTIFHEEMTRDPENFAKSEERARLTMIGKLFHWRTTDFASTAATATTAAAPSQGMSTSEKVKVAGNLVKMASSGYQLVNAIVAANGGGGGGGGGS